MSFIVAGHVVVDNRQIHFSRHERRCDSDCQNSLEGLHYLLSLGAGRMAGSGLGRRSRRLGDSKWTHRDVEEFNFENLLQTAVFGKGV